MIGFDSDESKYYTPDSTHRVVKDLEKMTGADWIVSPINLPMLSSSLIAKHLAAGAVLIQRKETHDLVSSIQDGRLVECITRMQGFGWEHKLLLKPAQKLLLPIGVFIGHQDESLTVSNQSAHATWKQFYGAMMRWGEQGGVCEFPLTNSSQFFWWLECKQRHLCEIQQEPVKEYITNAPDMWEASLDPLQTPLKVKDGRRILRQWMSEKQVNDMWDYTNGNLSLCIQFLCSVKFAKSKNKPDGIGVGLINKTRLLFPDFAEAADVEDTNE